ncbi:hypothetical protein BKA70DRAFT_1224403 [Coprinopsis sp. MPI-PUGE-AT-0042]|nr:hypothetical protein BKA70DRAFT_1224403 [Coprinopsis sp. MPI-PUGE-AT-0042]
MYSSNFVAVDPTASHKQNSSLQRCLDNRYTMSQGRSHSVWSTLASNARVDHIECNEKSVMSLATPTPATRSSGFAQQHHDTQHPLPLAPPRVPISTRAIQRAISADIISSLLAFYVALSEAPTVTRGDNLAARYHVTQEPTVPTLCARSASDRKNAMGIEVRSPNRTPECDMGGEVGMLVTYPIPRLEEMGTFDRVPVVLEHCFMANRRNEAGYLDRTSARPPCHSYRLSHHTMVHFEPPTNCSYRHLLSFQSDIIIGLHNVNEHALIVEKDTRPHTHSTVANRPNVWSTTPTSIESPIEILDLLSTFRHRLWPKFLLKDIDQEGDHTRSHFGVSLAEAFLERAMVPWSAVLGALPQILYSF